MPEWVVSSNSVLSFKVNIDKFFTIKLRSLLILKHFFCGGGFCVFWWFWYMVVVFAGLFMGCPTLLSPSICYVRLILLIKIMDVYRNIQNWHIYVIYYNSIQKLSHCYIYKTLSPLWKYLVRYLVRSHKKKSCEKLDTRIWQNPSLVRNVIFPREISWEIFLRALMKISCEISREKISWEIGHENLTKSKFHARSHKVSWEMWFFLARSHEKFS